MCPALFCFYIISFCFSISTYYYCYFFWSFILLFLCVFPCFCYCYIYCIIWTYKFVCYCKAIYLISCYFF